MKKADPKTDSAASAPRKPTLFESIRETFDSIAIAFILAFIFRTFEAEAFVIPTGSMALTLMGAHKELPCPQCGYSYKVGASVENPEEGRERPRPVTTSTCPNCRFTAFLPEAEPLAAAGDRILVTKYTYEFGEPQRFDVAVFKNPGVASQNYIKRLVGLPNEEVLIYRGDIYARAAGTEKFQIARKPPEKITSVMQIVYDNDFVLPKLVERGWPQRWIDGGAEAGRPVKWETAADYKTFRIDGTSADEQWLRYRHTVPTSADWRRLEQGSVTPGSAEPQLVTDFCEYNTWGTQGPNQRVNVPSLGLHWVSDLILECELTLGARTSDAAEVVLELVEGGRAFQCRIQAATGDVELRIAGVDSFRPKAKAAAVGPGPHTLRFANVDDHLVVWVDNRPLKFDASTNFLSTNVAVISNARGEALENVPLDGDTQVPILDTNVPKDQDLRSPAGIAAKGVAVEATHLRLLRDVYYVATRTNFLEFSLPMMDSNESPVASDYSADVFSAFAANSLAPQNTNEDKLHSFMSDVDADPARFRKVRGVVFKLEPDQFFMLGDNSPHSSDGRLWDKSEHFVKRELLIGKALFVYWPHGLDHVGGTGIGLPTLPVLGKTYFPNFADMRLIR